VLLASWALVVGFSAPAFAGAPQVECELTIEINALRGGSPTAPTGGIKEITSKARILKGSAPADATVTDTVLTITSLSGDTVIDEVQSPELLTLVVGRGGVGDKLAVEVGPCVPGEIVDFVSHFAGTGPNGAICEATSSRLSKTCK
jgi:hypothetical protein